MDVTVVRTVGPEGDRAVIAVSGEIDMATADQFAVAVGEQLGERPVLLDLRQVSFMDSSGLRALTDLLRLSPRAGRSLTIRRDLQGNVRRVFEMTGMLDELPLEDGEPQSGRL